MLRVERARRRMSQAQFGDLIGVDRTFYGALERGQRGVNISRLPDMAAGLGLPVRDLLPSVPTDRRSGRSALDRTDYSQSGSSTVGSAGWA